MKKLIAMLGLALCGLALTGCDPDDNAVGRFLYTTTGGEYQVSDQHGHQLTFTDEQARTLIGMDDATREQALADVFRTQFPDSYGTGSPAPTLTPTSVDPGEVAVSDTANSLVSALNFIPGWGTLLSIIAGTGLGISTIVLGKKLSTTQKAAKSMVLGINGFRSGLEQTPQGQALDAWLTQHLRKAKEAEGGAVVDAVSDLLNRFTTPDAPKGTVPVTPSASSTSAQ